MDTQRKLDDALFELQEYRTAVHYKVKMVLLEMEGMPNCAAIVVTTDEPLLIQPGMELLVVLPKAT